jgi:hypothetical protein
MNASAPGRYHFRFAGAGERHFGAIARFIFATALVWLARRARQP